MRRFRFSLASLLKHRESLERDRKRELAKVGRELLELEQTLARLEREYLAAQKRFVIKNEAQSALLAGYYVFYMQRLRRDMAMQEQVIKETQVRFESKRLDMVKAVTDRRALEIIRERRFQEYHLKAKREEHKRTDEIGLQQFFRYGT